MVRPEDFKGPLADGTGALLRKDVDVGDIGEGGLKLLQLLGGARAELLRSQGMRADSDVGRELLGKIKLTPDGQVMFTCHLQIDPDSLSRIGVAQKEIKKLVEKGIKIPLEYLLSDDEAASISRSTK